MEKIRPVVTQRYELKDQEDPILKSFLDFPI